MIRIENVKWRLTFSGVDRSEILAALRKVNTDLWEEAIGNMDRVNDEDPDTINVSVGIDHCDILAHVLAETNSVKCDYGRGLTFTADTPHWLLSASLFGADDQYAASSCGLTPRIGKGESRQALLDRITEAETALNAVRNELRMINAANA